MNSYSNIFFTNSVVSIISVVSQPTILLYSSPGIKPGVISNCSSSVAKGKSLLAKLPVSLPLDLLEVLLDVVHNVRKIPLILDLQREAFSALFCSDLDILLIAVIKNDLRDGLEVYALFVTVYNALRGLLVYEHLASFLSEGIIVRSLFNLVIVGQLLGVS